jgi:hypothetical protein
MRKLLSLVVVLAAAFCAATAAGQTGPDGGDKIRIVGVTPSRPVVAGRGNEFTVEVEYDLQSAEKGEINLGFNTKRSDGYTISKTAKVSKGAGTLTLKTKVTPPKRGPGGRFVCYVNLSKRPHESVWKPLASQSQEIPLVNTEKGGNQ